MSRMSFVKKESIDSDIPVVEESLAVIPTAKKFNPFENDPECPGEYVSTDFTPPRLNIVGKTGDLSNEFPTGSFLFMKKHVIGGFGKPIEIVVKKTFPQLQENLPWPQIRKPRVFNTREEVIANGGRIHWKDKGEDIYSEMCHIDLIIFARPEVTDEALEDFPYIIGERPAVLARYTVSGTAYSNVAKKFFDWKFTHKSQSYTSVKWELFDRIDKKGTMSWVGVYTKLLGEVSPEIKEELLAL